MGYRLWPSVLVFCLGLSTLQALVHEVRSFAIGDNIVTAVQTAKHLNATVVHPILHKDLCSVEGRKWGVSSLKCSLMLEGSYWHWKYLSVRCVHLLSAPNSKNCCVTKGQIDSQLRVNAHISREQSAACCNVNLEMQEEDMDPVAINSAHCYKESAICCGVLLDRPCCSSNIDAVWLWVWPVHMLPMIPQLKNVQCTRLVSLVR